MPLGALGSTGPVISGALGLHLPVVSEALGLHLWVISGHWAASPGDLGHLSMAEMPSLVCPTALTLDFNTYPGS